MEIKKKKGKEKTGRVWGLIRVIRNSSDLRYAVLQRENWEGNTLFIKIVMDVLKKKE